jgi:hypothetical protein
MGIAGGAARGLTLAAALLAGCTSRPLVATDAEGNGGDDDDGDDGNDAPQPSDDDDDAPSDGDDDDDDDGEASEDEGDDGVVTLSDDGPSDDGPDETSGSDTDTGAPIECPSPEVGNVRTTVWPGQDPLSHAQILIEVDCTIEERLHAGAGVSFELACSDANGPLPELVVVGVESEGIDVPANLTVGVEVHARVYTGRDLDDIAELPWRRANHFALYRDGALVLAAGEGVSFPSAGTGEPYTDFFAPVSFDVLPSECPGEPMECHDPQRGIWGVSAGGEQTTSPPFTVVGVGAFDVHLGELVAADTPSCGEPPYGWAAFAIAGN